MKYLDEAMGMRDADSGDEASASAASLESRLAAIERQMIELSPGHDPADKAELQVLAADTLLELDRGEEAWDLAREAFDVLVAHENWEQAVLACNAMFNSGHEQALPALGQGVWLAVTFPIDPEITVLMLDHIIEETPDDSDGAAVAAAVSYYIADVRATGRQRDELIMFAGNRLATVARRHSGVENQEEFDAWLRRLELDDPDQFLPRLRNVVDVLVQDDWWVDREAIWAKMAVN